MSTNFEDLIARNTRALQPAAAIPGRLYYVTDENVLERDSGAAWQIVERINVDYSDADVSDPPTDAELDAEFGTPATVGAGFIAVLDDDGAGTDVYIVASDGTNWWYQAMTQAV